MCCLRYEHEFYVAQRKRFPKEGKVVTTVKGHEKVVVNDIFRERVTLRSDEGETRILTLAELRFEMGSGERTLEVGIDDESQVSPVEGISEEVIRPPGYCRAAGLDPPIAGRSSATRDFPATAGGADGSQRAPPSRTRGSATA
jgi:hypothetical protein